MVSLSPSSVFASVSPVAALVVKPPVTAATLPSASTLIVALSVVTDTPSVPTVRPPLSFALTETLLSAETEIPSPAVTGVLPPAAPPPCGCSALIVTMCLPCSSVVVVTVTPSPLNSTSSPVFTIEAVLPLPFAETFQPNSFNVLDKFPALTSFLLFFSLGSLGSLGASGSSVSSVFLGSSGTVTLPSVTVRSTVSTLNLAERPVWSILTPSPSTK